MSGRIERIIVPFDSAERRLREALAVLSDPEKRLSIAAADIATIDSE